MAWTLGTSNRKVAWLIEESYGLWRELSSVKELARVSQAEAWTLNGQLAQAHESLKRKRKLLEEEHMAHAERDGQWEAEHAELLDRAEEATHLQIEAKDD